MYNLIEGHTIFIISLLFVIFEGERDRVVHVINAIKLDSMLHNTYFFINQILKTFFFFIRFAGKGVILLKDEVFFLVVSHIMKLNYITCACLKIS